MAFYTAMTMVDHILGNAPFVYEGDFLQGIARAKALGYDAVELHIADPAYVDARALRQALIQEDMRLSAIGTGRAYVNEGLSISAEEPQVRQAAVKRLEAFLDLGAELGALVILGCMRGNVGPEDTLEQVLERFQSAMVGLDAYAGRRGTALVLEPINRYENNFLCTLGEVAAFLRENGLSHTGILADTFHMNLEEADLCGALRACAPELRYVHLADSNRLYPGCGHVDFPAILQTLSQCGYTGYLSAECLPKPSQEAAAAGWIQAVKGLLR